MALNAVMPLFLLLALGYALKKIGVLTPDFLKKMNSVNFRVFLPVLLFNNIYKTSVTEAVRAVTLGFAVGALAVLYAVLCVAVPRIVKTPARRGVIIQGLFRSNYAILGVALTVNVFGEENAAAASVLCAVLVPLYNVLAVVTLAVFTSGEKPRLGPTLRSVATNPLILGALAGLLVSLTGLRFPGFVESAVTDVARLATPLALIVLGGDFSFRRAKGNLRVTLPVMALKLIVIPLCFVPAAVAFGICGPELLALCLAWETPVAASSYIMAVEAGADGELAGELVVLSTACCIPTVFLLIFILRALALL